MMSVHQFTCLGGVALMKYGQTNRWTKRVIPIYAHQNTLFARGMIRSGKGYVSTQNVLFDGEFKPQTGAELSEEAILHHFSCVYISAGLT